MSRESDLKFMWRTTLILFLINAIFVLIFAFVGFRAVMAYPNKCNVTCAYTHQTPIFAGPEKYEGDIATWVLLATEQATRTLMVSQDTESTALGNGAAKEVITPPARGD